MTTERNDCPEHPDSWERQCPTCNSTIDYSQQPAVGAGETPRIADVFADCRAEFEAWCEKEGKPTARANSNDLSERNRTQYYLSQWTSHSWYAWRAAWECRGSRK